MKLLKNIQTLAEKVSFTYDLQWDTLETPLAKSLLEATYSDALALIPVTEKKITDKYADKDFDWYEEDMAVDEDENEDVLDKMTQDEVDILSDPLLALLFELYTIRFLYGRVRSINQLLDDSASESASDS